MSELISGKEALTKVTEGIVQYKCDEDPVADLWTTITDHFWDQYNLGVFLNENTTWKFRLKPRTITLNSIEVPVPFEPKEGDIFYILSTSYECGYVKILYYRNDKQGNMLAQFGAWRTEDEIKQVVAALRKIFVINNQ